MGTWQMPLKIPPARVTLTSRTAAGAASLTKWIQKNPDLLKASNGLRPEILGKVPPPSVSISSRYDSATPAGGPLTIWLAPCRPLAPSGRLRAELRTPSPTAQGHLTSPGSASASALTLVWNLTFGPWCGETQNSLAWEGLGLTGLSSIPPRQPQEPASQKKPRNSVQQAPSPTIIPSSPATNLSSPDQPPSAHPSAGHTPGPLSPASAPECPPGSPCT